MKKLVKKYKNNNLLFQELSRKNNALKTQKVDSVSTWGGHTNFLIL